MTPKEAKDFVSRVANEYDRIEREKHGWTWVIDRKLLDVFSEIMLALGRSTRKPVSKGKVSGQSVTFCPTCRITVPREVRGLKTTYCPYCGQAIEWGHRKGEEHGD